MLVRTWITLALTIMAEAYQFVADKWTKGMQTFAPEINAARKRKITSEEDFQKIIATPSTLAYAALVDPGFISRHGLGKVEIMAGHATNLVEAFRKYNDSLDYVFRTVDGDEAKLFKELVAVKKPFYALGAARRTLFATGTRSGGRGPAATTGYILTGDNARVALTPADRVREGGPFLITPVVIRSVFRAALMGRLVQAAAVIVKGRYDPMIIAVQNALINQTVQRFIDPALGLVGFTTGGPCHVDFTMENNQLFLDIMVTQS